MGSGREVNVVLYRSLLRACRDVRKTMRPGHVVLVWECVNRFATSAPALKPAIHEDGPLPLCNLVRHAFRQPAGVGGMTHDTAFNALRGLNHLGEYVRENNKMFDAVHGISDRECPEEPSSSHIASTILRDSKMVSASKP